MLGLQVKVKSGSASMKNNLQQTPRFKGSRRLQIRRGFLCACSSVVEQGGGATSYGLRFNSGHVAFFIKQAFSCGKANRPLPRVARVFVPAPWFATNQTCT